MFPSFNGAILSGPHTLPFSQDEAALSVGFTPGVSPSLEASFAFAAKSYAFGLAYSGTLDSAFNTLGHSIYAGGASGMGCYRSAPLLE